MGRVSFAAVRGRMSEAAHGWLGFAIAQPDTAVRMTTVGVDDNVDERDSTIDLSIGTSLPAMPVASQSCG